MESLTPRVVPAATHLYAVGQDLAGASVVQVYREDGSADRTLSPFAPGFAGGARVATGDVTGDGTDDIVVAAGPGGGPEVKVYDGATGSVARDFFAYDPSFQGGVNVAVGDANADGKADIITGTGAGGGPNVRVFDGATGGLVDSFFAYDDTFRGGVNVAAGDVTGDGRADVVTGTGVGGGPRVQVFDAATGGEIGNFFAYDPGVRSGVTVAAGDLNGTGKAEIVTGVGAGGGPNVRVFDGLTDAQVGSFFAYDPGFLGGVAVGVAHVNGATDILTAPGPSAGGYAEVFSGTTETPVQLVRPFPAFQGGVTTGQGVATAAAPLNAAFAPVAPLPKFAGTPYIAGSSDVTGNGVTSEGDVFGGIDPFNNYPPPVTP